jgi:hypothetical protein
MLLFERVVVRDHTLARVYSSTVYRVLGIGGDRLIVRRGRVNSAAHIQPVVRRSIRVFTFYGFCGNVCQRMSTCVIAGPNVFVK